MLGFCLGVRGFVKNMEKTYGTRDSVKAWNISWKTHLVGNGVCGLVRAELISRGGGIVSHAGHR